MASSAPSRCISINEIDLGHGGDVVELFFRERRRFQLGPQLGVGAKRQHEVGAVREGRGVEPKHLRKRSTARKCWLGLITQSSKLSLLGKTTRVAGFIEPRCPSPHAAAVYTPYTNRRRSVPVKNCDCFNTRLLDTTVCFADTARATTRLRDTDENKTSARSPPALVFNAVTRRDGSAV